MINGVVLYRGPSRLDNEPVVVIATGLKQPSLNSKTGKMIQTFVLRSDVHPVSASYSGEDYSVCGDCPHRRVKKWGTCYVILKQSVASVWRAYKRGRYPRVTPELVSLFQGRALRIGSYGDPCVVPSETWIPLIATARQWTGYTHLWQICDQRFRQILMASCDDPQEQIEASKRGWRTFRVRMPGEPKLQGEVLCPASRENRNTKATCMKCGLCCGMACGKQAKNVVITVHGQRARRFRRPEDLEMASSGKVGS